MRGLTDPIRFGGVVLMMVGGATWGEKGGLIVLGIADLGELLIAAEVFFAAGLVGLHARLEGRGRWPGRIGGFLAYAAGALSAVNAPYSLLLSEDGPRTPFPFNITYFAGSLAVFAGLVFLGLAALRTGVLLPHRWRVFPLIIGLSALLPVWVLALVHVEFPIVALGLAWMLLGYVLWPVGSVKDIPR